MSRPDSKNLRIFGATFDYADRTEARAEITESALAAIFERHTSAIDRIAAVGSTVQNELGIRDLAIEFLHNEHKSLGSMVLKFTTLTRLTSEFRKSGLEVPEDVKQTIAGLFSDLEAFVAG